MSDGTLYLFCVLLRDRNAGWELKSYARNVVECPTLEVVREMHRPRMASGEIVDWAATCLTTELPLSIPEGLKT